MYLDGDFDAPNLIKNWLSVYYVSVLSSTLDFSFGCYSDVQVYENINVLEQKMSNGAPPSPLRPKWYAFS